jgi:hypothetical protein
MTAIANAFTAVTTADTHTGDTVFSDVPGASIADTEFVDGQKYLILVGCQSSLSVSSSNFRLQVLHGTTPFADSEYSVQPNLANTRLPYLYFTVWTAVAGEGIKLQHKVDVSTATVSTDQVVLFAMRLDADLTENTDWFYNENTTSNPLGVAFEDGASVTFTPGVASHLWLLLYRHQRTASAVTSQGESRADLSGGTAGNWGLWSVEGELAANDIHFSSFARAISLPASAHTFKVQGRSETADIFTHLRSAVFALDLGKFKDASQVFTATPVGYTTGTSWADAIATLAHTKTVSGDVLILAANIDDLNANTTTATHRLQVDNVDQPDTQTADIYPTAPANNDSTDQAGFSIFTRAAITANIQIDHDGHSNVATTPTYSDRALVCFSMELAGGAPPPTADRATKSLDGVALASGVLAVTGG